MLFVISLIICLILFKTNPTLKEEINKKLFKNYFDFAKVNEIYNKYLGDIVPSKIQTVSKEKEDIEISDYKDGAKVKTQNNIVNAKQSGIVIFAGEKENYGKTVIVQGEDKIEVWYGNLENISVSLYDYIKEGEIIANSINSNYYIAFQKEGEFLDYKKYF